MARILFLFFIIFKLCDASHNHHSYHSRRPHIFFFMGDDIGWNDVSWNNKRIHTPVMEYLARHGVILNNYYTFTVCTPSRASMMTGLYSDRLALQRGVLMPTQPYGVPLSFKLLPERLKDVGYKSFSVGKWHIGYCDVRYTPNERGVEGWLGFYNGGEDNYLHCVGYLSNRTSDGECQGFDYRLNEDLAHEFDNQYSSEVFARYVGDVLDDYVENDEDFPIFMYIALTDPHFPLQPPEKFKNNCNNSVNEARRTFCGAMSAMDTAVGMIVTKLRETRLYENSIIIFASDNGGTHSFGGSNYPLRGSKGTVFEGGARVPAFVHSPYWLGTRPRINKQLIHVSDWYPTILKLAGYPKDKLPYLDGVDQWKTIKYDHRTSRKVLPYLLDAANNGTLMAAVRDKQYKLIPGNGGLSDKIYPEEETEDNSFDVEFMASYTNPDTVPFNLSDKTIKLYDLQNDPFENNNLAYKMPEKVAELMQILKNMTKRSHPAMNVRNDSAGDPSNFDNSYTTGWCTAYFVPPEYAVESTNQLEYSIM